MFKLVLLVLLILFVVPITSSQAQPDCPPLICSVPLTQTALAGGAPTSTSTTTPTNTSTPLATFTGIVTSTNTPSLATATATATLIPGNNNSWQNPDGSPSACLVSNNLVQVSSSCGNAAWSSNRWNPSYDLAVSVSLRGRPIYPQSGYYDNNIYHSWTAYFCGLAILQDSNTYTQAAIGRGIFPAYGTYAYGSVYPAGVWWDDENQPVVERFGDYGINIDSWVDFTIIWTASLQQWNGTYSTTTWDGQSISGSLVNINHSTYSSLRIDLQGGPTAPSTCDFSNLVITGVLLP